MGEIGKEQHVPRELFIGCRPGNDGAAHFNTLSAFNHCSSILNLSGWSWNDGQGEASEATSSTTVRYSLFVRTCWYLSTVPMEGL